jgi:hypothetical protein
MQDPQERSTICNSLFGGKSSLRGVYPHFVLKAFMDIKWIIPNKKCFWLRKLENIVTEPFELRCFYQMFPHLATLWKIVAENHSCSPQANLSPPPPPPPQQIQVILFPMNVIFVVETMFPGLPIFWEPGWETIFPSLPTFNEGPEGGSQFPSPNFD